MATKLEKAITRVSNELVRDTGKFRPLVVTLYPNGTIGIRPQGTRREDTYPLEAVYHIAMKARVAEERAAKLAKKSRNKG